jgi:hypothetical protein
LKTKLWQIPESAQHQGSALMPDESKAIDETQQVLSEGWKRHGAGFCVSATLGLQLLHQVLNQFVED